MILLSRLIKSHYSNPQNEDKKVIQLQSLEVNKIDIELPEVAAKKIMAEAEEILKKARITAEKMMNDAQLNLQKSSQHIEQLKIAFETEKEALSETARQQGFQEGMRQGHQEANVRFKEFIDEAKAITDMAKADYIKQVEQSEETILKLGLKIAEKILHVELTDKKESFVQIVKHAIKEVKDFSDINIIVHPHMFELVSQQKDELKALFTTDKKLYIYPSEELQETSCMIESSFGRIDASIDSQLAELKVKLLELLEED
jgi:flagellar assembly protein FliH